jgi:hypothetical protein
MTHDELLSRIDKNWDDDYDYCDVQRDKALRAVVELHKPIEPDIYLEEDEKFLICSVCMEFDEDVKYPCQTILTIQKELQ